jgi:hypothetical protein
MNIDWKAPFQLAMELGLFLVGSIAVLLILAIATLAIIGLVRGFFNALKRTRGLSPIEPSEKSKKANLKSVE